MNNTPTGTRAMSEERADFEAWALRVLKQDAVNWKNKDGYVYLESEWQAWQARAAIAAQPAVVREALEAAARFIKNGVEFGAIRMPDAPDPALNTLPMIERAIAALAASPPVAPAEPVSDAQILHRWDTHVGEPNEKYPFTHKDKIEFARAILALATPTQADTAPERARVPMSKTQVEYVADDADATWLYKTYWHSMTAFARAVERHHGIGTEPARASDGGGA